jgi:mono/diheme cytochrome c family protein/class 3 adenylate cyclase
MKRWRRAVHGSASAFLILALLNVVSAQELAPAAPEYFEKFVRPVFAERCAGCHNAKTLRSGLDLTSGTGFHKGADAGPLTDAAKPEESRILKAITYLERVKMPPTGKLPAAQIEAIAAWVKSGAKWPGVDEKALAEVSRASVEKKFTARQEKHWAFQPRLNPQPPAVRNSAWLRQPIDRFILAKLEEKGLSPAPAASKLALLRRATFDLTGLPPTDAEVSAFLGDSSANAFERVLDRLLASPRYGEKWGRHWLDVARYADSTGADEDHRYPEAWKYRDWVIDAFNRDLPFDRMILDQMAGDMMPPEGDDAASGVNRRGLIATGFLAIGPRLIAEQDKKKMFYDFVDEQIATTSRGLLGLTMDCARCHDHKFDPISQKDYYSLASIFASTKSFAKLEGTVSQMWRPPLVPSAEYQAYEAVQKKISAKRQAMDLIHRQQAATRLSRLEDRVADYLLAAAGRPSAAGLDAAIVGKFVAYIKPHADVRPYLSRWEKASAETLPQVAASYQDEFKKSSLEYGVAVEKWRRAVMKAREDGLPGPDRPEFDQTKHRFFEDLFLEKSGPFFLPEKERDASYPESVRAELTALSAELDDLKKASPPEPELAIGVTEGEPVSQKLFVRGDCYSEGEAVAKQFPVILAGPSQTPVTRGSGRLELARWLTNPQHPLVARVFVNRVWQWHFGDGLVRTPNNFGLMGERPTHPELLDWLANEFVALGWSIKRLHKTIMLSAAYQQSSQITSDKAEKDAANRLWSRFGRRRLDVEEIRDAMLAIDGSIDLAMGGTLQEGTGTDGENSSKRMSVDPQTLKRRTVYIPLRRSNLPTLLNLFDFGDATTSGEGRSRTNVAPQALFAMNSPFLNARAGVLAEQSRAQSLPDVVREGFLKVLNRPAKETEVSALLAYMQKFPGDSQFDARRSLFRLLLASNEFIYVD